MTAVVVGLCCAAAGWLLWPRAGERLRAVVRTRPGRPPGRTAETVTMADLLDEMASLLHAGTPIGDIFDRLAAVHTKDSEVGFVHEAARRSSLGETGPDAIDGSLDGLGPDDRRTLSGLAACWRLALESGVPLADVVSRYAVASRADADGVRARRAAIAGPRATTTILTWLPIGGIGLGALLGAHPVNTLTSSPTGIACLLGGIGLLLFGRWWMSAMLAGALKRRRGRR